MKKILGLIGIFFLLSGCYATTHQIQSTFDPNQASWISNDGDANINGQAFLNTKGGTVVTCAGNYVQLTPVNSYSSERMQILYKSTQSGYLDSFTRSYMTLTPEAPSEYNSLSRQARCDAQGNFKFKNVPSNKEYFVTTSVIWGVDDFVKEGGFLMLRIKPKPSELMEIILN